MPSKSNKLTRRSRANKRNTTVGILGTPTAWPGSSAVNPGRAHARMVTEVFSSADARFFSKNGFSTWSSQLDGILTPYRFFRVVKADAEVVVTGGAASPYSVVFNISNNSAGDTDATSVLNDDYSGVSTALLRPKLAPPKAFWDERPQAWYTYHSSSDSGYNTTDTIAGSISLIGTGGASSSTVIGYLVVDMVVEFHTLA